MNGIESAGDSAPLILIVAANAHWTWTCRSGLATEGREPRRTRFLGIVRNLKAEDDQGMFGWRPVRPLYRAYVAVVWHYQSISKLKNSPVSGRLAYPPKKCQP
jgi:hypothetical protein